MKHLLFACFFFLLLSVASHANQYEEYYPLYDKFHKLAESGDVTAQRALGYIYITGEGVEQDYAEAYKWFKLAAEQDNASACFMTGYLLDAGLGVEENREEAARWFQKAADLNEPISQSIIGYCYMSGSRGYPVDYNKALHYNTLSAKQGQEAAYVYLAMQYGYGWGVFRNYAKSWFWANLADTGDQTYMEDFDRKLLDEVLAGLKKYMSKKDMTRAQTYTLENIWD